jgi:hypothetical protein
MQNQRTQIGYLVGGGLKENFRVRLTVSPQEIQEGAFVVIQSGNWNYYGIVTDIQLGATDPRFADEQMEGRFPKHISDALHKKALYANLEVLPNLMLEVGPELGTPEYKDWQGKIDAGLKDAPRILPVKNIPPHHAVVSLANEGDIAEIFGDPNKESNFVIGYTREQNHPVCIDLDKFVQRSSGVFGATGTGKSFLTRLVLAGLMKRNKASMLVLDMHNEYAYEDIASDTNKKVKGLKDLFKSGVRSVALGAGTTIRGQNPDFHLEISMKDISTSDIEMLTRVLDLKDTTSTTLNALYTSFKDDWFMHFKSMNRDEVEIEDEKGKMKKVPHPDSVAAWANQHGVNVAAAEGLHSKLRLLFTKAYIVEKDAGKSVEQIIQHLETGNHVILSFGGNESDLDYLLVSNLLTRRIRLAWEKKTNDYRGDPGRNPEPRPLIIVVEEAHKLLNREMAAQTTFATIARELRKYYVTLLIVDQRPSQIYDEVMSQLGTRISGWLGDDLDIQAVLSGLSGRDSLRGMLARLQPKEEVLLLGWGVPMPLPVRSRRYDEAFWKEMSGGKGKRSSEEINRELGFGG